MNKNVESKRIDWDLKSRSKIQKQVKDIVREIWECHIVYEEFPVFGTRYSLDFFNASRNIAIEVQGTQHTKFNPFFHKGNPLNFGQQLKRDDAKRDFCEKNDITLIELFEKEKKEFSLEFIKNIIDQEI
jgi:hypothetical protein